MKLTIILLTAFLFHASAKSVAQNITFSGENLPLEKVFSELEKQTGYFFLYSERILENAHPVTISAKGMPFTDFLNEIFKGQPLVYSISSKTVTISPSPAVVVSSDRQLKGEVFPPPITGVVRGPDGKPLAGVNVVIKNSKKGVTTNADGSFNIEANNGDVLVISSIGYGTKEVEVNGENKIVIELELSTSPLDEVQIIAYGTTSRRFQTGSVSSVKAEEIAKQPVSNPLAAMSGRMPGVYITQNTGVPGGSYSVQIRGLNSIDKSNNPFYVIDGVPYTAELLENYNPFLGNPLNFINHADIESIDVLKDADATAIYGSRGANGVILITTKTGKAGRLKANIDFYKGIGNAVQRLDLLNTQQYVAMRREAFENDNITMTVSNAFDLLLWDTTKYTDWQDVLMGGTAQYTDFQSSISGGTANARFLIGSGYHKETTVFPADFAEEKISFRLNAGLNSNKQKFKLTVAANYVLNNTNLPQGSMVTRNSLAIPPNAPWPLNDDGSLNWGPNSTFSQNPFVNTIKEYNSRSNNLIGNSIISYNLFPGLVIKSSFGYTRLQINDASISPIASQIITPSTTGGISVSNNNITSWIIEPQITFSETMKKTQIEAIVGSTVQRNESQGLRFAGLGYKDDVFLKNINAAPTIISGGSTYASYKYFAFFGRLGLRHSDKYLLNLTGRRDGTSRFGQDRQFHNFGSLAAGWIFSRERFVQNLFPVLNFGKIKVSYGITGNDGIGDYQFFDLYQPTSAAYQGSIGLYPQRLHNPDISWEETKKLEFGIDFGLFRERILLTLNFYKNKSGNQLLAYNLPRTTGFSSIALNFPAIVQNSGCELALTAIFVKKSNINWTGNFNFTRSRNKLVEFPNLESSNYRFRLIIGQPISIARLYHFLGVDPATGIYQFANEDGNATYRPNPGTDRIIVKSQLPEFFGGYQNSITIGQFQIDMFFQFVKKTGPNPIFDLVTLPGARGTNQFIDVLDRWQKPGDNSGIQKFSTNISSNASTALRFMPQSDAGYIDASFVRLKNISLSWNLTPNFLQQARLSGCRFYVQGQNLFTFTKYKGLDPETFAYTVPLLRVITAGISVSL